MTVTVVMTSMTCGLEMDVVMAKVDVTGAVYAEFPEGENVAVTGIVLTPLEQEYWEENPAVDNDDAVAVGFFETQVSA